MVTLEATQAKGARAPTSKERGRPLLRLIHYLRPLWPKLALALLCMIAASILGIGITGPLIKRLGDAVQNVAKAVASGLPAPVGDLHSLDHLAAMAVALLLAKALCSYGQATLMSSVSQRLSMAVRNQIYEHLQRLSLSFFERHSTGQLMSSITSDVPVVQSSGTAAVVAMVTAPVTIVGGTIVLMWLNWRLAVISLISLPLMAACIIHAGRRMKRYSRGVQLALSEVSAAAEETLSTIRVVKSFATERHEIARFEERSRTVFRSVLKSLRVRAALAVFVETFAALGVLLVLWSAGRLAAEGGVTWATVTSFLMTLNLIGSASRDLGNIHLNLQQVSAAAERIFHLLDEAPEVRERADARVLPRLEGWVAFEAVSFQYMEGVPVLQEITFELRPGEIGALVGGSGAGKSTVANLIPRFYDVTAGAVRLDGIDVRDVTFDSLRKQIGIVPQETMLFGGTIRENIAYGRIDATDREIEAAARAANAHEFIMALPGGYEAVVGPRGQKLSGGQRQRIAIARAVLKDPRILILDEATSSLDPQSEKLVQEALEKLMVDRTTLIIAHRLSTVRNANRIFVLDRGRIVESGGHDELVARGGAFARLVRASERGS
jgi:subfamily B ATP-binding cassette protein MsbA